MMKLARLAIHNFKQCGKAEGARAFLEHRLIYLPDVRIANTLSNAQFDLAQGLVRR